MRKFIKVLSVVALFLAVVAVLLLIRGNGELVIKEALVDNGSYLQLELPVEFTVATYNVQGRPLLDDTGGKFSEIGRRLCPGVLYQSRASLERYEPSGQNIRRNVAKPTQIRRVRVGYCRTLSSPGYCSDALYFERRISEPHRLQGYFTGTLRHRRPYSRSL